MLVNGSEDILRELIFEYEHVYGSLEENTFEEMFLLNVVMLFYDRFRFTDVINRRSTCGKESILYITKINNEFHE